MEDSDEELTPIKGALPAKILPLEKNVSMIEKETTN